MKTLAFTRFLTVVTLVSMTHSVFAQQSDSPLKEAGQLAKTADDNRQDWQAQYDAGCCYLDSTFSTSQYMETETYLRRALDIALAQEVKRDTILGKTLMAMSNLSARRSNHKEMLEYHQKAVQAYVYELGPSDVAIPPLIASLASSMMVSYCMGAEGTATLTDAIKLFRTALQLYDQLPEEQQIRGGRKDVETTSAFAHELLMVEQQNLMKDNVWQWTDNDDSKKYILLAFDNWTLEYPVGFFATLLYNTQNNRQASDRKRGMILMDEQGNVIEREHGQFDFNFNYILEGSNYMLNKSNTLRLTHVTSKRRKELIDTLHTFEQKKHE